MSDNDLMKTLVGQFEKDCIELDVHSHGVVNQDEFHALNQKIIGYQNLEKAYLISFSTLMTSKSPVILLQSVILAENSLMKEWESFSVDNFYELMSKIFEVFTVLCKELALKIIFKRFCHLIAKIFKRGHPIFFGNYFNSILSSFITLESSNSDFCLEWAYLVLFHSITLEYSEVKSSFLFLTSEDMIVFRTEFENTYLLNLFNLVLSVIFSRIIHGNVAELFSPIYTETTLEFLELLMSWRFNVTKSNFKYIWFQEPHVDFEPPETWINDIKKYNLCDLTFYLFQNFSADQKLGSLITSILLQYASFSFNAEINPEFVDYHVNKFLTNFTTILPSICQQKDPSLIWCTCLTLRKFVETPIRTRCDKNFTSKSLAFILSNSEVFIYLIQTIASELANSYDDVYIDAADDFFAFIQFIRDSMYKYSLFGLNNSSIMFDKLKEVGCFLLERDLVQPLGCLEYSNAKTQQIIERFNNSAENDHQIFWLDESAYTAVPELSLFISTKLASLISHFEALFKNPRVFYTVPYVIYNLRRLIRLFINSLIDSTSYCFMYHGAIYLHKTTSMIQTNAYLEQYFNWFRKKNYDSIPDYFTSTYSSVNGHIQCLVLVLMTLQLLVHNISQSSIEEDLSLGLSSILDFLNYFPLFFEKITVLCYKNGELEFDDTGAQISFIQKSDMNYLVNVIFDNCYIIFNRSYNIPILNNKCTSIIKKVVETAICYTLFDYYWVYDISKTFLGLLDGVVNNSQNVDPLFVANFMSLFFECLMFCSAEDGVDTLSRSMIQVIEHKFSQDSNNFPATGFQSNDDSIEKTWLFNLAILEGLFTKFNTPKHSITKYPTILASVFDLLHKTLAGVIGKGGNHHKIILKYIKINRLFCAKFIYCSPEYVNIKRHLELFELVSNTYFVYVKNRIPLNNIIDEKRENNTIMKIFHEIACFCITIIHITDAIKFNSSNAESKATIDKIFYISKNTIFSILNNSPTEYFLIPKFTDHIFDAISEFCSQFAKRLLTINQTDMSFLIRFISLGLQSDNVKRKSNLFESTIIVIENVNESHSNYSFRRCPLLMNPIIEVIVGIMTTEPISLDLLNCFCHMFIYLLKFYNESVTGLIRKFMVANNVSEFITMKMPNIMDNLVEVSRTFTLRNRDFDSSLICHNFLNLVSILRSQICSIDV